MVERAAMILAGDIGGTNTRLVLAEPGATPQTRVHDRRYASRDAPDLVTLVREFLAGAPARPRVAAFGVAGPVLDGRARPTNLDWHVDARELAETLGLERVLVRNDLQTTAYGLAFLRDDQFEYLNRGERKPGNAALIAAGTGLGESILVSQDGVFEPLPSEGGHAEFAPRDAEQDALLLHLRARFGAVSWERVVSGPGLANVYEFLLEREGAGAGPARDRLEAEDPPRAIAEAALGAGDALCGRALDLFVRLYGAEAGHLALKALAVGGVYVGGGIAPRILPALRTGAFVRAFQGEGVLRSLLAAIPVKVVLEPDASLIGATALGQRLAAAP